MLVVIKRFLLGVIIRPYTLNSRSDAVLLAGGVNTQVLNGDFAECRKLVLVSFQ